MAERLGDVARRIARIACALVGAQRWVVYSIGADGNAGRMLWADEDERRCTAYFSRHYRHDPLAPHRLGTGVHASASLRQRLAAGRDGEEGLQPGEYECHFMRPYRLSDAIDMLLPVGPLGAGLGISLLRDAPHPPFEPAQLAILADFHVMAAQTIQGMPQTAPRDSARARLAARCPGLTSRELDVALAVAAGMPNKLAARHAGMSPATVKTHLHSIYRKCGVVNRSELARLAA